MVQCLCPAPSILALAGQQCSQVVSSGAQESSWSAGSSLSTTDVPVTSSRRLSTLHLRPWAGPLQRGRRPSCQHCPARDHKAPVTLLALPSAKSTWKASQQQVELFSLWGPVEEEQDCPLRWARGQCPFGSRGTRGQRLCLWLKQPQNSLLLLGRAPGVNGLQSQGGRGGVHSPEAAWSLPGRDASRVVPPGDFTHGPSCAHSMCPLTQATGTALGPRQWAVHVGEGNQLVSPGNLTVWAFPPTDIEMFGEISFYLICAVFITVLF